MTVIKVNLNSKKVYPNFIDNEDCFSPKSLNQTQIELMSLLIEGIKNIALMQEHFKPFLENIKLMYNPLMSSLKSITSMEESLKSAIQALNPDTVEIFKSIETSTKNMHNLINSSSFKTISNSPDILTVLDSVNSFCDFVDTEDICEESNVEIIECKQTIKTLKDFLPKNSNNEIDYFQLISFFLVIIQTVLSLLPYIKSDNQSEILNSIDSSLKQIIKLHSNE